MTCFCGACLSSRREEGGFAHFPLSGRQGLADRHDFWCRTRTADHALQFPGCLRCDPLSLSCPLLAMSLFPGLNARSVSVYQLLWEKMAMTEVETSGWKEALGLSDALNHLCANPCCPGELRWAVSPGACGVGFQGPEFQRECGRLESSRAQGAGSHASEASSGAAISKGKGPGMQRARVQASCLTAAPPSSAGAALMQPLTVWNGERGFVPIKLNYRSFNLNFP